jgi:hypothetical protein
MQDTGCALGSRQEAWSPAPREQLELFDLLNRTDVFREVGSWADVPARRIAVVATLPRVAKLIPADPRPRRPPRRCEALPGGGAIRREAQRDRDDSRGRAEGVERRAGDVGADLLRLRAGRFAAREHLGCGEHAFDSAGVVCSGTLKLEEQGQELRWDCGMKVRGSELQPSFDDEPRKTDQGARISVQCAGTRTHQCDAADSGFWPGV